MNAIKAEPSAPPIKPWSAEECTQERLQEKVLEKFQSIVRDVEYRKSNYQSNTSLLSSGYWYPSDYFKALTITNKTERLNELNELKLNGSFCHGLPPEGFVHVMDDQELGGKRIFGYTLKEGVAPADALKSVRESLCFIDCQEAIQLAYYDFLLEVWGEEVFNRRFGLESKSPLTLDPDTSKTPLHSLMSSEVFERTDEDFYSCLQKGHELYFRNIPLYSVLQFNGEATGYHCLCSEAEGKKKFIAFGIPESGLNEEQMLEWLAGECNSAPIKNSEVYSGLFLEKVEEKKRQLDLEMPLEIKVIARSIEVTVEHLRQVQRFDPKMAGLVPNILMLDAEKVQQELQ